LISSASSHFDIDRDQREKIQDHLGDPTLRIYFNKNWGSQNQQHRNLIAAELTKLDAEFKSVSHCPGMGVIATSQFSVGIDIEVSARVTKAIAQRIQAAEGELDQTVPPHLFWVAKESAFKAFRPLGPELLSQILVQPSDAGADRTKQSPNLHIWESKFNFNGKSSSAKGISLSIEGYSLGVSLFCTRAD
jgi:hypothetical protein